MKEERLAYPRLSDGWCSSQSGMTLREYYAGLAMQGLLAGYQTKHTHRQNLSEDVSRSAFDIADAMIAKIEESGE